MTRYAIRFGDRWLGHWGGTSNSLPLTTNPETARLYDDVLFAAMALALIVRAHLGSAGAVVEVTL